MPRAKGYIVVKGGRYDGLYQLLTSQLSSPPSGESLGWLKPVALLDQWPLLVETMGVRKKRMLCDHLLEEALHDIYSRPERGNGAVCSCR